MTTLNPGEDKQKSKKRKRKKLQSTGLLSVQHFFYFRPDLQEYRSNIKHDIYAYYLPGTISLEEEKEIHTLVLDRDWMASRRWLSERKASEIGVCKRQYHARNTELKQDLEAAKLPYRVISVPNPDVDEALHFMVFDPTVFLQAASM